MNRLVVLFAALAGLASASAPYVYIAQNQAGAGTGLSCLNARPVAYFNTSMSWGAAANQIGPGTTVHLCGTFTAPAGAVNYLQFQGSGSPGNPVVLMADPGAILQAPYWGRGAITATGLHDIVVDGMGTGIIRATANGTARANQQSACGSEECDGAIVFDSVDNGKIQNWSIADMYVSLPNDETEASYNSFGIIYDGGQNAEVCGNSIHDAKWGVVLSGKPGLVNRNMTACRNTIWNVDHGVFVSTDTSGTTMDSIYVYGNSIHDASMWDDALNNKHHDGIHVSPSQSNTTITNVYLYSNHIYGDWGTHCNAFIFLAPGGPVDPSEVMRGSYVFNNLLVNDSPADRNCANGLIQNNYAENTLIANNTMVGKGTNTYIAVIDEETGGSRSTVQNNIFVGVSEGLRADANLPLADYNVFFNVKEPNYFYATLAGWQAASGQDLHSSTADPLLSPTYVPGAGGSAAGKGANLSGLGIGPLGFDYNGTTRGGTWDIGAINSGAAPPATSISISPVSVTLGQSGQQQFSAVVLNATGPAVWAPTSVGTLSASGLYTAPASIMVAQNVAIKATSGTASASATVTLQPPAPAQAPASCPAGTVTIRGVSTPLTYQAPC